MSQNYINHVAIVLDASSSMNGRERDVIKAVDNQIKYLARRSQELDQETRVSVYTFSYPHHIRCAVFDKDVLRLPSIQDLYVVGGNTALIDATLKSIDDLKQTAIMYGDHSFLIFVFTDGEENNSVRQPHDLRSTLDGLPDSWTVAALVPHINAKMEAQRFGFPNGNIAVWDVSSITGVEEAMTELQTATDQYMVMRASGQSGTKKLFSTDAKAVNAATIQAAGLKPLKAGQYDLVPVTKPREAKGEGVLNKDKHRVWEISEFVRNATGTFRVGSVYYQMSKKERIQGNKLLAILDKKTSKVYVGDGVRAMVGLPDADMSVAPDFNPDYDIYVQSSSTNRHLVVGTKVLVVK